MRRPGSSARAMPRCWPTRGSPPPTGAGSAPTTPSSVSNGKSADERGLSDLPGRQERANARNRPAQARRGERVGSRCHLDVTLPDEEPHRMAGLWGCRKVRKNLDGTRVNANRLPARDRPAVSENQLRPMRRLDFELGCRAHALPGHQGDRVCVSTRRA